MTVEIPKPVTKVAAIVIGAVGRIDTATSPMEKTMSPSQPVLARPKR